MKFGYEFIEKAKSQDFNHLQKGFSDVKKCCGGDDHYHGPDE